MGITNATSKGHPAWVTTNLTGSNGKSTAVNRATSATTRVKGLIPPTVAAWLPVLISLSGDFIF